MIMKNQHKSNKRKAIIISIIAVVVVAAGGVAFYLYNRMQTASSYAECVNAGNPIMDSYPQQCRTPDGKTFVDPDATRTLEGTAVCLPHKNTDGPQTLECAIGIKTTAGVYYGVSGDKENQLGTLTGSDTKVRITGQIEKATDTKYDISELISVKKIEILN